MPSSAPGAAAAGPPAPVMRSDSSVLPHPPSATAPSTNSRRSTVPRAAYAAHSAPEAGAMRPAAEAREPVAAAGARCEPWRAGYAPSAMVREGPAAMDVQPLVAAHARREVAGPDVAPPL